MRTRVFYRLAALAPFALPVAGLLAGGAMALLRVPGAGAVTTVSGFLGVAAYIGGLPYLVVAGVAFWWLRDAPVRAYQRAAWIVPLPHAALLGATFLVLALGEGDGGAARAAGVGAAWAGCALAVGYFYVALIQGLHRWLARRGIVADEP